MPVRATPVGSSNDHGKAPGHPVPPRRARAPPARRASCGPATTAWSRAWPAASAATSASTPPRCASPSWCSPSPTASARCCTWSGWALLPDEDPSAPPPAGPSAHHRADRRPRPPHPGRRAPVRQRRAGRSPPGVVWAVVLSAIGFGLVWSHTDEEDRTRSLLWRAAGGGVLLVVGLGRAVRVRRRAVHHRRPRPGRSSPPAPASRCCSARGSCASGATSATERRERIRSEERSEIAAHLHDSVLQTLALIQRADAPGPGPHAGPPPGARAARLAVRRAAARRRRRRRHAQRRPRARRHRRRGPPRHRGRPGPRRRLPDGRRASRPSSPRSARPPTTPPATPGCRR